MTMEDLSHLCPGGPVTALAPTSQAGGNMMSSNDLAMTAPGGRPVDPLPDRAEQGDPAIDASGAGVDRRVTHGTDAGLHGGRPVLRIGRWNDAGGGPAPEGYRYA
jgi:hypothetical protein